MISTSLKIRKLFELAKGEIDLPYFSGFPNNACEGASLFLGAIIKEKFPTANVEYLKAYDGNGAIHFWLEIDGKVFDITADQFPEIESPLFGVNHQPFLEIYNDIERQEINEAFKLSDVTNSTYKHSLMMELRYHLSTNI
ncbi:hypothetical protein N8878_08120 [Psychromonas sp.]|nr:hypothetical protein [Psychromonas sp.]